ncbi:MAG: TonB-dependent receptor [Bacteroidales bacterium]|nr:TonB-dependent receptor [Bacteroidales bacterium]
MNVRTGTHIWSILPVNRIIGFLLISVLFSQVRLYGQSIEIHAEDLPLNQVLLSLVKDYGVQLSFDDRLLSSYQITADNRFESPEQAIRFLIKDFPLEFKQIGKVFTIYRILPPEEIKTYRLAGRVVDSKTGETLPYSHVIINKSGVVTDVNGNFSFVSGDSLFHLTISYLGYYIQDTILSPGTVYLLGLTPSVIGLKEVVVEGSLIERSGQSGEEAGIIRLNHKIAYRLPGNGDNAVFNFLRLQPGILASGERSTELIIWGSYSGHSKIMFDGFTIFGLKNFNDNISFVNPYMAKDIKVLKGGYPAEYDNRVGGGVDISGINGSVHKPSINLNINNMTINGMAGVPLTERSSLTFAYRQTYYNLLDAEDLNIISGSRPGGGRYDINVYPDYLFRDFNLKYAGTSGRGDDYFISLYDGRDQFSYEVEQERNIVSISQEVQEKNRQRGGSAFYGRTWNKGVNSHLSMNISGLNRELFEKQIVTRNAGIGGNMLPSREALFYNDVLEYSIKNKTRIPLSERQMLETGLNYTYESVAFRKNSLENTVSSSAEQSHRVGMFLQDEIRPGPRLSIRPGIRIDYPVQLEQIYLQPRIQLSFDLGDRWRLNGAAGIYRQFISQTSVIDELGNSSYLWEISNNTDVPVLKANHLAGGLTFRSGGLTLGVESFYKTTSGIARHVDLWREGIQEVYQGDARMYGTDLLVKQYFRKHEVWASYTWSRTEEHFPYMPDEVDYRFAPQDQRHEIKGALLLNFSPFFLSANYVYGSGFRTPLASIEDLVDNYVEEERYPYNRLDLALIYRLNVKNYHFEAGISVLNVFNHENIKYSNVILIPDSQTTSISIHAEAVPFTPTLYMNMSF